MLSNQNNIFVALKSMIVTYHNSSEQIEYHYIHSSCFVLFHCGYGPCTFYPYPSGLLHWHWGNHMIAPVPVKEPWRIRVNASRTDHINSTIQSMQKILHIFCTYSRKLHLVKSIDYDLLRCTVITCLQCVALQGKWWCLCMHRWVTINLLQGSDENKIQMGISY